MAGGSGERFWPISRRSKPKQLLKLLDTEKSMISIAIERVKSKIPVEDIFVITSDQLLAPIRESLSELPPQNIIAEPSKRNTAPCLALAAAFLQERYRSQGYEADNIVMTVLTADHQIEPKEKFSQTIETALNKAAEGEYLVTIGIEPQRTETGYGYIETKTPFDEDVENDIRIVEAFHEKPDIKTALHYLAKGNYYWNSGMFFWRLDVFKKQLSQSMPAIGESIDSLCSLYSGVSEDILPSYHKDIEGVYNAFDDISIDYALMEKAEKVAVVKASFEWDDIGSWDSYERIRSKDEHNNITRGNTEIIETQNSIIFNDAGKKMLVSVLGMDGVNVIVTDDAILVCPKDRVQEVKTITRRLREKGKEEWL